MSAHYDMKAGGQLQTKIAISYTSVANARQNLMQECPGWAFDEVRQAAPLMSQVVATLSFHQEEMAKKARQGFMNAADVADWLAKEKGLSFRQGYEVLSLAVKYSEPAVELTLQGITQALDELQFPLVITQAEVDSLNDPLTLLAEKNHTGAPGPKAVEANLTGMGEQLKAINQLWVNRKKGVEEAKNKAFTL